MTLAKRILGLVLAMILIFSMAGCQSTSPAPAAAPEVAPAATVSDEPKETPIEPITITTHTTAPPGDVQQLCQESISKAFDANGQGMFKLSHFDSASLVQQDVELEAVRNGDIDIAWIALSWFSDEGAKWISMYSSGYLFENFDHANAVMNGEIGQKIYDRIWDEFHLKVFGCTLLGTRNLWLTDKDMIVNKPEDLSSISIRCANSPDQMYLGAAIGAKPVPMSGSETYMSMKTGVIDGQENTLSGSWAANIQEVAETIVLTEHLVTCCLVVMNGDKWESMSPEQQKIAEECFHEAIMENNEARDEAGILAKAEDSGLLIQKPDKSLFAEHVTNLYLNDPNYAPNWDMDMYNQIRESGAEYAK